MEIEFDITNLTANEITLGIDLQPLLESAAKAAELQLQSPDMEGTMLFTEDLKLIMTFKKIRVVLQ
jgi:hypothetical protein